MAYSSTSRPSWQSSHFEGATLRLTYKLHIQGRVQPVTLSAHLPDGTPLRESDARGLAAKLHPLDSAIVRELGSSSTFTQLNDTQLARLLPLLAQRQALVGNERLRISDENLSPRLSIEAGPLGGLRLTLYLETSAKERWDLNSGRLLAGPQAFFMINSSAFPVASNAPWELANWTRTPFMDFSDDLSAARRDDIVRTLAKLGVPSADLERLAVLRSPPQRFIARLFDKTEGQGEPVVNLVLEADYAGEIAVVGGREPQSPYIMPQQNRALGLIERDLEAEHHARAELVNLGFRFDAESGCFIGRGESALSTLDPNNSKLPSAWTVDRSANAVHFRSDLSFNTSVKLEQSRGLLELQVGIQAIDDQTAVQALIEMKDLLDWLNSGRRYVRLADGSYVAPSAKFRRSLKIWSEFGADGDRALVSPLCIGLLKAMGDYAAVSAADAATQKWLQEVSNLSEPPHVEPPSDLTTALRDYQKRGLDWLHMLHRNRLTGILADDMGLGKTVQALSVLLKVRDEEGAMPSLVVAPTSVVPVWRDEAARFAPSLKVALWHGDPEERKQIAISDMDLIVTSYGTLRRDAEILAKISFRYVILDEAQSAKNASTQNARSVRRLKSERRLAITGTPVENRPEELWATFDFLAPGFLGSLASFRKRYARPITQGSNDALWLLHTRTKPLILRRLKSEVAKELPPKIESLVRCEMQPGQRALYDHIAGRLKKSVQEKIEKVGIERAHLDILAALTRLRQICCDPSLLPHPEGAKIPGSAKLELFGELMREALASDRKVLVFSQFVEMQKRLIKIIQDLGVEPLWLHGGTKKRDKVVAAFQAPDGPPVIVVSLKAGGTGLTLTRADTVMHYDPWWNPAVERQATDRTHRLGQKHQVTVYKLICADTIEDRVTQLANQKDDLAEQLLGSDGALSKRITADDIMNLLN